MHYPGLELLATAVLMLDDRRATPCEVHDDGKDFVKTNKWIVFGHHFAAIAGPVRFTPGGALGALSGHETELRVIFGLLAAGFGVKAGIVPLHIWLPAAHPVAPSNVSALLSGVLIKTGIYGLTRVFFDFLGAPPMWWAGHWRRLATKMSRCGSRRPTRSTSRRSTIRPRWWT